MVPNISGSVCVEIYGWAQVPARAKAPCAGAATVVQRSYVVTITSHIFTLYQIVFMMLISGEKRAISQFIVKLPRRLIGGYSTATGRRPAINFTVDDEKRIEH